MKPGYGEGVGPGDGRLATAGAPPPVPPPPGGGEPPQNWPNEQLGSGVGEGDGLVGVGVGLGDGLQKPNEQEGLGGCPGPGPVGGGDGPKTGPWPLCCLCFLCGIFSTCTHLEPGKTAGTGNCST